MPEEEPPLTEEELSELEKELSEKRLKSKKKLSSKEIEKAKKEFLKKKEKKNLKEVSNKEDTSEKEPKDKKPQISFTDINKFVEAQNRILQNKDLNERKSFADNIEKRVSYPGVAFKTITQDNKLENKEEINYSAINYDNSKEKTYDPKKDVEHNLVRTPTMPEQRDLNQLGRENPLTSGFNREINFKPAYTSNKGSKLEQDYVITDKIDTNNPRREENSFFEMEFGKKDKKYDLR